MYKLMISIGMVASLLVTGCGLDSDSGLKRELQVASNLVGKYAAGGYVDNQLVEEIRVQNAYAGIFAETDLFVILNYQNIRDSATKSNISLEPNHWNKILLKDGEQLIVGSSRGSNPQLQEPDTQAFVIVRRINGELQMNKMYYFRNSYDNQTGFFSIANLNKIRFVSYLPAEVEVVELKRHQGETLLDFRINLLSRY